jgi:Porin subfamily
MTMKSLLLGAAAGIAAVSVAQAADLPMTKGEAVEYVKVCSAFGTGFFYIPGTDTCLKIGGEVRADYRVFGRGGDGNEFTRNDNRSAFGTQGRVWFDARTQTDYGLLRSYFQINADGNTATRTGTGKSNNFSVDKAFIQFGGLTAGYAHSFFGFYDNEYGDTIFAPYYAEGNTVNLLAYTAQFGGGFSATLSIEDGRNHRADGLAIQGGQQVPDVVGQLRYDADWGSLAAQAAGHQFRTNQALDNLGVTQNKYGYAVGGTALIKLPFIDGGHFVVEGQYADGALDYLGTGNSVFLQGNDLYPAVTEYQRGKGWSIVAELGGNITPVLNANLVGSYIDLKYNNFLGVDLDGKEYTIAGNLTYTIVKGLTLGGEVSYTHAKAEASRGAAAISVDENRWEAGMRLKRSF